jgi:glucosamine--fructose-6-phosphate aminotransferase (isomerizing)
MAGLETLVATKTYANTLALLWLLVRAWNGDTAGECASAVGRTADRCQQLLATAENSAAFWLEAFAGTKNFVFLGHGPHAFTARQSAMMMSEWAKTPALSCSAGAFRHGFIEMAGEGLGAVIFASGGPARASSLALADELKGTGAQVLVVENGASRSPDERLEQSSAGGNAEIDEFLAPILDVLPVQAFMQALAQKLGIPPGFRRLQKVVKAV